ncbi:MAG: hypothetical protein KatS3mg027_0570 [Bacteroidia bacterium]|nr:MAG: hypothetical protein KatS3mg027_0570 [Bacteroidia bacterium]
MQEVQKFCTVAVVWQLFASATVTVYIPTDKPVGLEEELPLLHV